MAHQAGAAEPDPHKKHEWNLVALSEANEAREVMVAGGMYSSLYNNLGLTHSSQGDTDEAKRCYELAIAHLSDIPPGPYANQCRSGIERNLARLG